ncbi:N-acetyltransferase family protein [Streptomyces shenzhenensis]|uniref:GNAT family N-acetyltransferase n=1 Tax=Streptomyces shenzhenensis TaxID=943815 RepID=UPI003D925A0A
MARNPRVPRPLGAEVIEAGNAPSIRLHERFGFHHVGTVREAGIKFGRRLDLTIMRLSLT